MLEKKRVDCDANETDRQARCEIIAQVIRLQPPGQPPPNRLAGGLPQRSPKRSRTGLGARKSQRQLTLLRLRSRQSCLELEVPMVKTRAAAFMPQLEMVTPGQEKPRLR